MEPLLYDYIVEVFLSWLTWLAAGLDLFSVLY